MFYVFNFFLALFISVVLAFLSFEYLPSELKLLAGGLVLIVGGLAALWNLYLLVSHLVTGRK